MARLRSRARIATAVSALAALAAAPALGAPSGSVTLTPNQAGKPSTVSLDIHPDGGNPKSIVVRVARGFKFDPRATKQKCSPDQAKAGNCPAGSRIGGGTADATVHQNGGFFPDTHFTAQLDLYAAPPPQPGDVGGVVIHFSEPKTGQQGSITGRVTKGADPPYDLVVRFDGSDQALKAPQGFSVRVDRIQASFGAKRTVKKTVKKHGKKHKKKVRRYLVRNPKKCSGSWPFQVEQDFGGGPVVTSSSAACTQ